MRRSPRDWPNCCSQPDTTLAAKQFICLQLRQVGTAGRDPAAGRTPASTRHMSDGACMPSPRSRGRSRRTRCAARWINSQGDALVGVINALGARRDPGCVERLMQLARSIGRARAIRRPCVRSSQIADDRRHRLAAATVRLKSRARWRASWPVACCVLPRSARSSGERGEALRDV